MKSVRCQLACGIMVIYLAVPCSYVSCSAAGAEISQVDPKKYKACGANALYECARIRGNRVTLKDVYELLKPGADGVNTFAEIADAAQRLGYFPVAASLTYDSLAAMPTPSIVHVREFASQGEGDHFIVYLGSTLGGEPVCLNAPQGPKIVPKSSFKARWTGNTLILCDSSDKALELRSQLNVPFWQNANLWGATAAVLTIVFGILILKYFLRR